MEIRPVCYKRLVFVFALLLAAAWAKAQPPKAYSIKKGRMYIQLPKPITKISLDSFVVQYDLAELDLESFLKTSNPDSLWRLGWQVEVNNETGLVISKEMKPFKGVSRPEDRIIFKDKTEPLFPAVNNGIVYGVNNFRNKEAFALTDSTVRFFMRGHPAANRVVLAGSFNNWVPGQLLMKKTDSGWVYDVKLGPGKYWYKFIVDGNWTIDRDNLVSENDGRGNINSVFFRPNKVFSFPGFSDAGEVFLAGSFNNWKRDGLRMKKAANGWQLPLYLADGTYTYKFVADGKWHPDPGNRETVSDGTGGLNSVLRLGQPHLFQLKGFPDAKEIFLVGSFNQWRDFEWRMKKTADGWELPFALGPGNYEYQFKVGEKLISDPANALTSPGSGRSFLVLHPNYTFRLKGFSNAKAVYLAGDFNQWEPKTFAMKREGDEWVFPVHLSVGKHLYKFVVDGKWITDPANKFWEQNEYGSGNSILWIEK